MSHYLLSYYVFFWFILYIFFWNCILYLLYCIHALYVLSYIIFYYIILYYIIYCAIYIYMYVYAHTEWRMHVGISQSRPPTHQGWIARPCAQASVIPPICNAQRTHCQLPLSWGGISSSCITSIPETASNKNTEIWGWCQASKIDQFLAFLLIT